MCGPGEERRYENEDVSLDNNETDTSESVTELQRNEVVVFR